MKNFIYHNPRWGKSRKSVEILNKLNIEYTIIEYLKEPLTENDLTSIINKLKIKPSEMIRKNEAEFKDNNIANLHKLTYKICKVFFFYIKNVVSKLLKC